MKPREKVIQTHDDSTKTGYLDKRGEFIYHSFDNEPAIINNVYKVWYNDGNWHRDNNLPAVIWSAGNIEYYKNDKRYWFINNEEYYSYDEIKEKFKNNILKLKNVNSKILKDNGIDAIHLYRVGYLILDQAQYNLAIFKFL